MSKNDEGKRTEIKWCIMTGILLAYVVFFGLKINGCFDFTSRYDIERIDNIEGFNSVYMIDNDTETTWGLDTIFPLESVILIKFREIRSFGEIGILNVSDEATVPMSIYVSFDGEYYSKCVAEVREEGRKTLFTIPDKAVGEYLLFIYEGGSEGHWPITEVQISD